MVTCPENPPSKYLAVACTRRALMRARNASPMAIFLPETRNGMIDLRTTPVDDPGHDRLAPRGYASIRFSANVSVDSIAWLPRAPTARQYGTAHQGAASATACFSRRRCTDEAM